MKRVLAFVLVLTMALISFGAAVAEEPLRIGVCYCMLSAPAVKVMAEGVNAKAAEYGMELIELDAEFDATKQTDQMSSLISQGVDGIVLNPVDAVSIVSVVKQAYEAGIPVVMASMDIDESGREYVVSYSGADDYDVGYNAGEKLAEALGGEGQVAIIEGQAGTSATTRRTEGFEDAVADTEIEVVAKLAADFDTAKAMAATEDLLTRYPDIDGIFSQDDTMCVGVVQAMKSMGYTGEDVAVVSYNGSQNGYDMVKNGDIIGTAVQPLTAEGSNAVEALYKAINGEEVEPWLKSEIQVLDATNIDDYDTSLLW